MSNLLAIKAEANSKSNLCIPKAYLYQFKKLNFAANPQNERYLNQKKNLPPLINP
jgi:hypothetical protein